MRTKVILIIAFCAGLFHFTNAQIKVGIESGAVFSGYNDARIPNAEGTKFSLSRDLEGDPFFFYRLNASYTFHKRHSFTLLFAPLQTTYNGRIDKEIHFANSIFAPNTDLKATYKFNSYRLTYRYDIVMRPRFEFGLGFTAKIRDAKIALESSSMADKSTNVGFVPILNFRMMWHYTDKLGLLVYGDALAAPQGRAEDVLLAATYQLSDKLNMHLGYRILEGGGDAKSVYSFANFNYASVGITYTLSGGK